MRFDLRYLDTFVVICETGGFRRAAEQLHVSQPAVSHRMGVLESELGLQLFERRGRRLIITPAGERLYEWAHGALSDLAAMQAKFSSGAQPGAGGQETLSVSAVSGFGRYVLFPLLCDPAFNGLRIDLRYETAIGVFDRVEGGACDIGFVYHAKPSTLLRFDVVYIEEAVLVAGTESAIDPVALHDPDALGSLRFITYEESDYVFGAWFDSVFGSQPRTISSVHHFEELEEVVEMVALGKGLSILPSDAVLSAVEVGRVQIVRPNDQRCVNDVFAVSRRGRLETPATKQLIERLRGTSLP
ncbi:MAG: LysR family transcriptional regulator [Gemmatimonadota bacterium]|jgi:DNA-binding transcriptional LysR family regulator